MKKHVYIILEIEGRDKCISRIPAAQFPSESPQTPCIQGALLKEAKEAALRRFKRTTPAWPFCCGVPCEVVMCRDGFLVIECVGSREQGKEAARSAQEHVCTLQHPPITAEDPYRVSPRIVQRRQQTSITTFTFAGTTPHTCAKRLPLHIPAGFRDALRRKDVK